MSTIPLREYHHLIDNLLEQNANSEAIFHCTNILTNFPKSIKTYQQLGQALLEKKRFTDAAEVFSKVISVFPDDFVAHAGLSVVHEENRELDKAIWHMEQAFETQPSNTAIQDEFRRLISRRDGAPPSKIRLTRGALIRMYAKGELYQQAIAEALSALQSDKDRVDIKLLLARMYVMSGSETSAVDICSEILTEYPYCFEANRILFELTSTSSDPDAYDPVFLQRLTELDPYFGFIETAAENVYDVPAEKVMLEKADYYPQAEDISRSPEWADKVGIPWHDDAEDLLNPSVDSDVIPENINVEFGSEMRIPTPFLESEIDESNIPTTSTEDVHSDIPEWITKAGWIRANEDEQQQKTPETSEGQELTTPVSEEVPAQPADSLPDWLHSIQPEGSDSPQLFASSEEGTIPEADIPPLPPEMLAELLSEEHVAFNDNVKSESTENLSVKLPEDSISEKIAAQTSLAPVDESIPDLPDWLKDLDHGDYQVPEFEIEVPTPLSEEYSPNVSGAANIETPDFISELESIDLLSEIETNDLLSEIESTEPLNQSETGEIPSIPESSEIPLDIDMTIDEVLDMENLVQSIQEEEVDFSTNFETNDQVDEILSTTEIEKPEPERSKQSAAIPSWVKSILSGAARSAHTDSPLANQVSESDLHDAASASMEDETIEELLSDLPGEPEGEGALSQEVTSELENWLEEIESDNLSTQAAELTAVEPVASENEAGDLSFESLFEESEIVSDQAAVTEFESETESVDATLDARLSSMIDTEISSVDELVPSETLEDMSSQEVKTSIERVIDLLQSGEFTLFTEELGNIYQQDELSDQVITELSTTLKNYPQNYELWQDLGDLQSKKSNFNDALNAYREAEKNILL